MGVVLPFYSKTAFLLRMIRTINLPPKWVLTKLSKRERSQYTEYRHRHTSEYHYFYVDGMEITISKLHKMYSIDNALHRLNGPAYVNFILKKQEWYIHGVKWD
jgi:hypothetical protein